jgi:TolA-binding protein
MTRLTVFLLLLAISAGIAGCGGSDVGRRYRAERALWKIQREAHRLSIQPRLVDQETWRKLASDFEAIAARNASVEPGDAETRAGKVSADIRTISARALISAAQIYAGAGDSLRMMATYERVRRDFQDLPRATSEVALAQGRIAEVRRDWAAAASAYEAVIRSIEPVPGRTGVAGTVLELPLRVARLRARAAGDSSLVAKKPHYAWARKYYEGQVAQNPGTAVGVESRIHLAELDSDLGEWRQAVSSLSDAEKDLTAMDPRPWDPAEVRFAIGRIQTQWQGTDGPGRDTFQSLVTDYPESRSAPRALIALSGIAAQTGDVEAALGYLDQVRDNYSQAEDLSAQALLARGTILEQNDRWGEALKVFRSLPAEHPVSESALRAPLAIVAHYTRVKDTTAAAQELERAESWYREFLVRYPTSPATLSARRKLVQVLSMQERYGDAVQELVGLGKSLGPSPQGAQFLLEAARMSIVQLADTVRTADILEYTGQLFSEAKIGRWALSEAKRLREEMTR